jgi:hypothetical protein
LSDEVLRGVRLPQQSEQVEQVVARLIVVTVLAHRHRSHLSHFVYLLTIAAHLREAQAVKQHKQQ